jgi:hypothetical protein
MGNCAAATGNSASLVEQLRSDLTFTDLDHGLLDNLRNERILSRKQIRTIQSRPTKQKKIDQLLNYVRGRSEEQLLAALDGPGEVYKIKKSIDQHWTKLIDLIDSRNGLLDEMLSAGCINNQQVRTLCKHQTQAATNEGLLAYVTEKKDCESYKDYYYYSKLIESLIKTNQRHAAWLLAPDKLRDVRPLCSEAAERLRVNCDALVELLDTSHGLLTKMYSKKLVTARQKEFIEMAASTAVSNERLLDVVRRGTESDFDGFLECLRETGQTHVSDVLGRDGVVVHLIITTVEQNDARFVEQFTKRMDLLKSVSVKEKKQADETKSNDVMNELWIHDVELKAAKTQSGRGNLFCFCTSFSGFCYLNEQYLCGHLRGQFDEALAKLTDDQLLGMHVKTLTWKAPAYMSGMEYYLKLLNLPILAEVYHVGQQAVASFLRPSHSLFDLTNFPAELIETIVMKAVVQLSAVMNKASPRAEICAFATICAVTSQWRLHLTGRQRNMRLLKSQLRVASRPSELNVHDRSQCFAADDCCSVRGVAEFNEKLYAVFAHSDVIRTFNNEPPFGRLDDIRAHGLQDPRDIVLCDVGYQLYIADCSGQRAVWRLNVSSANQVEQFVTTPRRPWSISMRNRRLLITPYDGEVLLVYRSDDRKLKTIELPRYMFALHAVETSDGSFVVSHYNGWIGDTKPEHNSVSVLNVNGAVVRTFDGRCDGLHLNSPYHLAIDGDDHVIVADRLNERVVVLESDLRLKRVLMTSLDRQPIRLCLGKKNGSLVVAYSHSNTVTSHKIYHC